jgi:hypothetical protein
MSEDPRDRLDLGQSRQPPEQWPNAAPRLTRNL